MWQKQEEIRRLEEEKNRQIKALEEKKKMEIQALEERNREEMRKRQDLEAKLQRRDSQMKEIFSMYSNNNVSNNILLDSNQKEVALGPTCDMKTGCFCFILCT